MGRNGCYPACECVCTFFDAPEIRLRLTDVVDGRRWSAVVRGALLRGLQGDIVSTRKIRNFYGIEYRQTWDPEIHEVGDFANEAAKHKYLPGLISRL